MDDHRPLDSLTVHAHKRQLAWQILVPFLVVTALIIAAAVLVATGTASATRTWADVSTIWLIAPMLIFALLLVILLGFMIYGIAKLLQFIPRYTGKAQDFFALLSGWTRKIADGTARPFVWFQQAGAILKSIFKL
jgi:type II secretory pathway component PulL